MIEQAVVLGPVLAKIGAVACMTLSALGSSLGAGAGGSGAVGAWKKCLVQKKPAPFQLLVFAGAPLSQTIYGMILMFLIYGKAETAGANGLLYLWAGLFGGLAMGVSAWMQGKAAAVACDSFAETGKGFTNDLMILGIIETCALFIMAFLISVL
jgi:V/A-type H+-transporting ATPase subunit K